MTAYDDVWSGSAAKALSLLPAHVQDQAESLVREICREPHAPRYPQARTRPGYRLATAGGVAVLFEVALVDNLVRIAGVNWIG